MLQVLKGASRVRIPPSPQSTSSGGRSDNVIDESHEQAWAAGFYDAEGSMSTRTVGRPRAEIELSQGSRDAVPSSLVRFQAAIGGFGYITQPKRGYLYYWRVGRREHIEAVLARLWPRLDEAKRAQIRSSVQRDHTLHALMPLIGAPIERPVARGLDTRELAWAAGLFSGDGSVGAYRDRRVSDGYRRLMATLPQASEGDVPSCLVRFRSALLGLGNIAGPRTRMDGWGRLPQYRWEVRGFERTQAVVALLWPWLTTEKRTQAHSALVAARGVRAS